MNEKKTVVKGFGANQMNEENSTPEKDKEPTIEEELATLIWERYDAVNSFEESTDQKSTIELVDEMEAIAEPKKNLLFQAMKNIGFKLEYTGTSFVWLLKDRKSE